MNPHKPSTKNNLRTATNAFMEANGLSQKDYETTWTIIRIWKIPFIFPNIQARRIALPIHDMNHTLTKYETTLQGETQLSAFELGAGCGSYWFAWFINLHGLLFGLFLSPRKTYQAFARGNASRLSLYELDARKDEIENMELSEARQYLGISSSNAKKSASEAFIKTTLAAAIPGINLCYALVKARRKKQENHSRI